MDTDRRQRGVLLTGLLLMFCPVYFLIESVHGWHKPCLKGSVAVKRHNDHGNSYKGKHLTRDGSQFRGLAHRHHDGKP